MPDALEPCINKDDDDEDERRVEQGGGVEVSELLASCTLLPVPTPKTIA